MKYLTGPMDIECDLLNNAKYKFENDLCAYRKLITDEYHSSLFMFLSKVSQDCPKFCFNVFVLQKFAGLPKNLGHLSGEILDHREIDHPW